MISADLIADGLSLMLFGMGFVFLFLAILVLATMAMSTIVNRYCAQPVVSSQSGLAMPSPSASDQEEVIAAISAAIQMHRTRTTQSATRQ